MKDTERAFVMDKEDMAEIVATLCVLAVHADDPKYAALRPELDEVKEACKGFLAGQRGEPVDLKPIDIAMLVDAGARAASAWINKFPPGSPDLSPDGHAAVMRVVHVIQAALPDDVDGSAIKGFAVMKRDE